VVLYTDGVSEAETLQFAQFGMNRLEQAVLEMRGQPARGVVENIVKRVAEFAKGAPQSDDITCIAVVRKSVDANEDAATPTPH
jgi:sigma-B regulation protein RsbU (phosphoserine phosphatase)